MDEHGNDALDCELLRKVKAALEHSIGELNDMNGTDIQLEQFVEAFDPSSRTIHRLLAAVVKESVAPRRPSEPGSPATSLHGMSAYGSLRGGQSPAVDGGGSWMPQARRNRMSAANVDLDHVRSLMEAIEIVSPNMVGADIVGCGSPIPESRTGWSLPGQVPRGPSEQHGPAASLGAAPAGSAGYQPHTHAMRHRRTSVQVNHGPGIPIGPTRSRKRSAQIDPIEFAEYAVAHMRPSPRFTPMGSGFPLSSSASESRSSLPRSFLSGMRESHNHHAMHSAGLHLPRQNGLGDPRHGLSPNLGAGGTSREPSPGSGRSSRSPAMDAGNPLMNGDGALA
ncbi:hypothetical protein GGI12_004316 [Dipsacomyces acuminosporus]|nr:hypothetical protein GGI12_004316 [Dipsacomyces acuminosporus]